ncbi:MAG: hypothetical protein ABI569_04045 [Casimicrobiaceae bacterium]
MSVDRQVWLRILVVFMGIESVHAAAATPGEMKVDGRCPDLSGTYREAGVTIDRGARRVDAHLSWMIGGGKEKGAKRPLSSMPAPPSPIQYDVQTMRISHPAHGKFALEAFDGKGESLGTFEFGPTDGWQCGESAFFNFKKREIGGEGTWNNQISLQKLYKSDAGILVRSIEIWHEERSILTLGLVVGAPSKTTDVQYRFEQIK